MNKVGHQLTGLAGGIALTAMLFRTYEWPSFIAIIGGWLGGNAPDYLEAVHVYRDWRGRWQRRSLFSHRGITHWWVWWFSGFIWSLVALNMHPWSSVVAIGLAGFCLGGLVHLLVDLPNHKGIPTVHPFRGGGRFCLHWVQSGGWWEPLFGTACCIVAAYFLYKEIKL